MRVHGSAAECLDERLRQDRAETGDCDQVDIVVFERGDDRFGIGDTIERGAEIGAFQELVGDPVVAAMSRARQGRSARTTTTGRSRSKSAWRMVPVPEARTPTRIPRTLASRRRADGARPGGAR